MKNSLFVRVVSLVVFAAASGAANALPVLWTDNNSNDVYLKDSGTTAKNSYSFTHDITDGADGFRPGIDSITGAWLSIIALDDLDRASERASFKFDGAAWTTPTSVLSQLFDVQSFLSDGLLNVTVKATQGDFWFKNSFLLVTGERGTSVPEPSTLAIFGVGLLALLRRRRQGLNK